MLVFVAVVFVLIGLIHFYLWKRLVRDTTRGKRARRLGAIAAVVLAVLLPATLIGTRTGHAEWLAWPGYVWLALMFYLLVVLLPLEIPRAGVLLWWRAQRRGEKEPVLVGASAEARGGTATDPGEKADAESKAGVGTLTDAGGNVSAGEEPGGNVRAGEEPAGNVRAGEEPGGNVSAGEEPGGHANPGTAEHSRGGIERRLLLARGAAIFAGLTAAGVTAYGMKTALGPPQINRWSMPMAKLPRAMDGTRLAVVSDIHLGPLTGTHHVGRIVDLINSVKADIVCVVGDLVDGSVAELGRFATPLADIESRYGAYFVTGNHEYYSGYEPWIEEVASLGVRPLRNERVELGGLDLAGVNDLGGTDVGDPPDFRKALGDRDTARPVVLMAHQPAAAHEAAPFGVDLQVSGHTHGGQMAPFNLLVKLDQPVVSGYGDVDGVPVYVTNGAGFWGPPVRVGAPPQVTVVELRSA